MKLHLTCAVFLFVVVAANAWTLSSSNRRPGGECQTKKLTPRHFLNLQSFLGDWYAQTAAVGLLENVHKPDYKCLGITFSAKNQSNHINLQENYLEIRNGSTQAVSLDSDVEILDALNPAVWAIHTSFAGTGEPYESEAVLLHTDHESWHVMYTCGYRNGSAYEGLGLYTRQRNVSAELKNWLEELAVGLGFPRNHFVPIEQTGCVFP